MAGTFPARRSRLATRFPSAFRTSTFSTSAIGRPSLASKTETKGNGPLSPKSPRFQPQPGRIFGANRDLWLASQEKPTLLEHGQLFRPAAISSGRQQFGQLPAGCRDDKF